MSKPEGFAARWSRRKREAEEEANIAVEPPVESASAPNALPQGGTSDPKGGGSAAAEATFDLSTLPSLESITATTDIRPFLAAGVPKKLRQAALRRVWSADPVIRDFKGLAELDWDFNAPDSMAGFGPLQVTDALRRFVLNTMTSQKPAPASEEPDVEPQPSEAVGVASPSTPSDQPGESGSQTEQATTAAIEPREACESSNGDSSENVKHRVGISTAVNRRGHGSAIPG
jgi:hypothetical protein